MTRRGSTIVGDRYRLTPKAQEALQALEATDPVVYATGPSGALTGLPVRPRCRRCRELLADCNCSGAGS